ncbi:MAG: RsmD family RNA methyltransferase [Thermoguttaceae bacterium]|nr:RsmD family RNA methyltransferase [Thermoguttaceae bacterium]MDW8038831.1 RsmD family RNA methyltransferase [Thermoguttaceae bacterium]
MGSKAPGNSRGKKPTRRPGPVAGVRIIAGRFRGRRLRYSGDPRTRPMKDRVREALFSILGQRIEGKYVLDLFAGTGALGLEAMSRGASGALFLEYHRPTAALLRENITLLGLQECCQVLPVDTFIWFRRRPDLPSTPWLVFCSPPYEFYQTRQKEMLELIGGLLHQAPPESLFVVEADSRFDFRLLPHPDQWDIRHYRPAVLAIYQKPES